MGVMNNLKRIKKLETSGAGGSVVGVEQIIHEGTNIANITVNGVKTELYAPSGSASSESSIVTNGITSVTVNENDVTASFTQKPFMIGDGHIMCMSAIGLFSSDGVAVNDNYLRIKLNTEPSLGAKMTHLIPAVVKYTENGLEKNQIVMFQHSGNEIATQGALTLEGSVTLTSVTFASSPWFLT